MQYLDAISKKKKKQKQKDLCSWKTRWSLILKGKPFNSTVIQVYAQTSNTEEAEVERFYEDMQDLLELTPKKDVLFIMGDWNQR